MKTIKLFVDDDDCLLATFYSALVPRVGETVMVDEKNFTVKSVVWEHLHSQEPIMSLYCGEVASYEDGKAEGHASGFEAGYEEGKSDGYDLGQIDGYAAGLEDAKEEV